MRSSNCFGEVFTVSTFGESRSTALGVVVDGVPAGLELSFNDFTEMLERRKSHFFFETARKEADSVEILSGVFKGHTVGSPICIIVRNAETSEKDYSELANVFRPGHADEGYQAKYGYRDYRGGGRSSGRETLARVIAGAIAKKLLLKSGIECTAEAFSVAGMRCENGDLSEEILSHLHKLKAEGNSCGGTIACTIKNVPIGLGEPVFSKLDAELAKAMLSIGSIKGIDFGEGFGFESLDGLTACSLEKNYNGGIVGGISTGEPIRFRVAFKPVPSIAIPHPAKTASGEIVELSIKGRHDTCLVFRLLPVVESMAMLVLADFLLRARLDRI